MKDDKIEDDKIEDEKSEDEKSEDEKSEDAFLQNLKDRMEHSKKKLETLNQKVKILERIEKYHLDNTQLKRATDNNLFLSCISEIESLPYRLHLNDKRKNKKGLSEIMTDMIRYEYTTKKGEKPIIWVYFPTSSTSKIHCRLQKFGYSFIKVKQPKPSDIYGKPSIEVCNEENIKDLISCINEYMTKGMGVNS